MTSQNSLVYTLSSGVGGGRGSWLSLKCDCRKLHFSESQISWQYPICVKLGGGKEPQFVCLFDWSVSFTAAGYINGNDPHLFSGITRSFSGKYEERQNIGYHNFIDIVPFDWLYMEGNKINIVQGFSDSKSPCLPGERCILKKTFKWHCKIINLYLHKSDNCWW